MKNMRFSTRLSIYLIALVSTLFLLVLSYNYVKTYNAILDLRIENVRTLAQENVEKIERVLQKIEQTPLFIANSLSIRDSEEPKLDQEIQELIFSFIESNPDVYGSTLAVAPGVLPSLMQDAPEYFAPYYFKDNNEIHSADLASESYKYWKQDWYIIPSTLKKPFWSEPYFDAGGGNALMTTYSVPIYRINQEGEEYFFGVITADISLDWLQEIVDSIPVFTSGFTSIIGRKGMFISYPNKELIARPDYTLFDYAEEYNSPLLYQLAEKMTKGESGIIELQSTISGKDSEAIYTPLPSTGWSLILSIPRDEFFAELFDQTLVTIILAILGIIGITIVVSSISYRATKPLRELSKSTKEIAQGKLDISLPKTKFLDEIGELSLSFENMRIALKEYIANLTKATAVQERIESELEIAKNIQASFLPKSFSGLNETTTSNIDICASLSPARAVGGDLYDFFYLDENKLFLSVGDVSGKGVPAALFMAVTQTLIKSIAKQEKDPASILYHVNNSLTKENDACMFVTLFCAILNTQTGELIYTNAGHESPILLRKNEAIQTIELPKGLALGIIENTKYKNKSIALKSCDKIIVYTDGVTDALSINKEKFGVKNLYQSLESLKEETSKHSIDEIINSLQSTVKKYEQGMEQFDDITLLGVHVKEMENI